MNHAISAPAMVAEAIATPESVPQYTARNSGNWERPDHGKAQKYLPGVRQAAREEDRQTAIRKAKTLRHAIRLNERLRTYKDATPYQVGVIRLFDQLLGIREAESLERLLVRDRTMAGMLEGVHAFEVITTRQLHALAELRENAYRYRLKELEPCATTSI